MFVDRKPPKKDWWKILSGIGALVTCAKFLMSVLFAVGVASSTLPPDTGQKLPPAAVYHVKADSEP